MKPDMATIANMIDNDADPAVHKKTQATVKTTVTLDRHRIIDTIINAVEFGIRGWVSTVSAFDAQGKRISWGRIETDAASIVVVEHEGGEGPHNISLIDLSPNGKIGIGLQVMADTYPTHFMDLVNKDDDATTADVFMQCVCLGEIAYG